MPVIKLPAKTAASSAASHIEPTIVVGPPVYTHAVTPTIIVGPPVYTHAVTPTITVGPPVYTVAPTIIIGPPVYTTLAPTQFQAKTALAGASSQPYALGFTPDPEFSIPGPVHFESPISNPAPAPVPGYIGDKVFFDANRNGLQDAGEAGLAGQTVQLFRPGADRVFGTADDQLVATQLTQEDGSYRFTHMFGQNNLFLDSTKYQVAVTPTAGYGFTKQDAGNDSLDSDFGADGRSQTLDLAYGQNITSVDAGLVKLDQAGEGTTLHATVHTTITTLVPRFDATGVTADPSASPSVSLMEPSFTLRPDVIVGPNTQLHMPVTESAPTLYPEILAKVSTAWAGLQLLHGSDDLLHTAFGAPAHSTAPGGEAMGHAGEILRQLLTAMDAHATSTVAMA